MIIEKECIFKQVYIYERHLHAIWHIHEILSTSGVWVRGGEGGGVISIIMLLLSYNLWWQKCQWRMGFCYIYTTWKKVLSSALPRILRHVRDGKDKRTCEIIWYMFDVEMTAVKCYIHFWYPTKPSLDTWNCIYKIKRLSILCTVITYLYYQLSYQ